ncbi:MAG: 4'-phosphopantetheinyl transferase superfamily protein [Bacteroidetes bacterium]|nr:MAG: 4'-phosphopantetheinyl transferase superfamily protein [Bacteroidota bacterium]
MTVHCTCWSGSPTPTTGLPSALAPNEVQLWLADIREVPNAALQAFHNLLSPEERLRAEAFRLPRDERIFTLAHGWLRTLLGACLNHPPEALEFEEETRGKPYLSKPPTDLQFNLSHSPPYVAVALAKGRPVGCDVEWLGKPFDWQSILENYFSPEERRCIRDFPSFLLHWTRKETLLKITGHGLVDDLPAISLPSSSESCTLALPLTPPHNSDTLAIHSFTWKDAVLSLGAAGTDWELKVCFWNRGT